MAGILRRSIPNRRSRRKNSRANRPQPTTPISIASATPALALLTIVFDQPVSLNGVPQYTTDVAGVSPIDAQMTGPMTLELTFDNSIALATAVNVPYEDPAVRNASGGFVSPVSFQI